MDSIICNRCKAILSPAALMPEHYMWHVIKDHQIKQDGIFINKLQFFADNNNSKYHNQEKHMGGIRYAGGTRKRWGKGL